MTKFLEDTWNFTAKNEWQPNTVNQLGWLEIKGELVFICFSKATHLEKELKEKVI